MSRAWVFGDNVTTEDIIRGPNVWKPDYQKYLFDICRKDLNQAIQENMVRGDFIIARKNFGIGSSRQRAVEGLIAVGIKAIIAKSFAFVYGETAVSLGLPIYKFSKEVEVDLQNGDNVELEEDNQIVMDQTNGKRYKLMQVSPIIKKINKGGIIKYIKEHGDWPLQEE